MFGIIHRQEGIRNIPLIKVETTNCPLLKGSEGVTFNRDMRYVEGSVSS